MKLDVYRTDHALITLLETDPERGMAELIETYSGLLWNVCAPYLRDPEDTKECVNEAFTEFYLHKERFQPEKGTLKAYLTVIARRCALHCRTENKRWETAQQSAGAVSRSKDEIPAPLERMEQRDELDRALTALESEDEQIIRMKYYGDMTAREIAASLGLPYETVKKRHQRSMKKLRRILTIGLVVALLTALLAACTYFVLRYFGFVPGYGVNTDPEANVYVLEERYVVQSEHYEIHLEDAFWRDGILTVNFQLKLNGNVSPYTEQLLCDLTGLEDAYIVSQREQGSAVSPYAVEIVFRGGLPEAPGDMLELILTVDGTDIPLILLAADEEADLDQAGFYRFAESGGGLLAVPRIENGELVVSIYPLDEGDFKTNVTLTSDWFGNPTAPVTVTAPDGTVLEGKCDPSISPYSEDTYLDWHFGPAEPGEYVLNIPYVYQHPAQGGRAELELPLLREPSTPGLSIEYPGGAFTLDHLTPVPRDQVPEELAHSWGEYWEEYDWWYLSCSWTADDLQREPSGLFLSGWSANTTGTGVVLPDGALLATANIFPCAATETDLDSGEPGNRAAGYWLTTCLPDPMLLGASVDEFSFRWNQPFIIPMTVPPEGEKFIQESGDYGLIAIPKRVDGQTVITLTPYTTREGLAAPYGGLSRNPLSGDGTDDSITLVSADGTVYEGTFQPGRSENHSNWMFGDLPAGNYTVHVPYLYVTGTRESEVTLPLPQVEGDVLDTGLDPWMENGCTLELGPITGLGLAEGLYDHYYVFTQEDGSVYYVLKQINGHPIPELVETNYPDTPMEAVLSLSMCTEESAEFTLLDVQVKTDAVAEWEPGERQYTYDEDGTAHLSGVLLRYVPGLTETKLVLADATYRWNHAFDIPIVITE